MATLVGDIHGIFSGWMGYGMFTPGALDLMRTLMGRVDRVVMRTERDAEAVHFDVCISDPDVTAYEEGDDLRCVWSCRVQTKAGESQPSAHVTATARDQQLIADRCVQLLTDFS